MKEIGKTGLARKNIGFEESLKIRVKGGSRLILFGDHVFEDLACQDGEEAVQDLLLHKGNLMDAKGWKAK